VTPRPAPPRSRILGADDDGRGGPTVRSFLRGYLQGLTVLLGGLALLLLGWTWASSTSWAAGHPWAATAAATVGWSLGVAGWLSRRGWHGAHLHTVSWAAPVAVLLPLIWPGWLSPDGLLLGAPLVTVFAVALAMPVASH
jgi:hypothetical protein